MNAYVIGFQDIDKSALQVVGGKGANLGEIARLDGIRVPDGFCVTTDAFKRVMVETPAISGLLDELSRLGVGDRARIGELSAEIRRVIEGIAMPADIRRAIAHALSTLGHDQAYAVRSSATAEDLPTASFAGQQDTYLNVIGEAAILQHVSRCWASLFTERAVTYRIQHGFDHRQVQLAVVIQRMVFPQASGILFTADPVTGNRKVSSIDAGFGLGEALVAGLVTPDVYKVRDGQVVEKQVSAKKLASCALAGGGTTDRAIAPERQHQPVLTDEQIVELARLGRRIEGHFRHPQDIEWCLVDGAFYIVQSRPITTLFPVPDAPDDARRVYVSVGHGQMMTAAMKPLGWSVFQMTAGRPMYQAGGRLFIDIAPDLASPDKRWVVVNVLGKSDPLIKDALMTLLERGDFIEPVSAEPAEPGPDAQGSAMANYQTVLDNDPSIVSGQIARMSASIDALRQDIRTHSGPALFDFIQAHLPEARKDNLDPHYFGAIVTGMNAAAWINDHMLEWLGEKNVADRLSQSAPNNVTSEMGLALLDVADAIRPYPAVIEYLNHVEDDGFLDALPHLEGGKEARDAIQAYLAKYGMRCAGEIDITRARWSEKPTTLVPLILRNLKNFEPGAGRRKFDEGLQDAMTLEQALLDRLKQLPEGAQKAEETKEKISLMRNFIGFREFPKYAIVNRYFIYKQALLNEAERLVQANVLRDEEDIYYLTFEELREVVRTHQLDDRLIRERKEAHALNERLTPPRVITSDGEVVAGRYKRDNLPAEAIVGMPVSSGVIEGRARVVLEPEDADLEDGDILVTAFTDPSWTPLFVAIKGLVTEAGGLMSHGAVIAREYGIPAITGLENATKLIQDGQRIRLNGTDGYVEVLS
jgi:pyruvate,water dikinase